jgi:two-component system cell cycle response regulator DivK
VADILIVEDNPDNMKLFKAVLGMRGHAITGLTGGEGLVPLFTDRQFDLVLLDIQLPGRDGYALLEELKQLPERSWKVVALTAHALPEDRARATAAGFDGYITKPIDVRTFPAEVARYLQPR